MANKERYYLLDNEVRYYPATQMVHHVDRQIHLTDFQHKLLMNFLQHPGQIRTQSEICQQVWPNKITTVDAFNKPLGAIRNALSNHQKSKKNHYIKTWSREGYSLQCSCELVYTSSGYDLQPLLLRFAAFTLVSLLTIVVFKNFGTQAVYETGNLRRLTPLVGIAAEPTLSDDGNLIAFTFYDKNNQGSIFAKQLSHRDHVILTQGHNDKMPAISPTSDRLLYQRLEDGQCQIRMLTFAENLKVVEDEQLLLCSPTSFFVSMSWHDDNSFYYTDSSTAVGPYSIYRFDLTTGLSTLYLAPEVKINKEHNGFARVLYHRADKKLYIIHSPDWVNSEIFEYHQDKLSKIATVDTAIGSIGTFNGSVIYKDKSNRLMLKSQQKPLTTSFNRPVLHPATSQNSNKIAYYIGHFYQWNIYSYQVDNGQIVQLTANNAIDRHPIKTFDDFYYSSNFTGVTQIYRQPKTPGSQPLQLSNFTQDKEIVHVSVTLDGKIMAISDSKGTEIYEIKAESLILKKRFAGHIFPSFAADSKRLMLSQMTDNSGYIAIEYDLTDFTPTGLRLDEARFALYSRFGIIYSKNGEKGLYLLNNGRSKVIDDDIEVFKPAHITAGDGDLYVIDQADTREKQVLKISLSDFSQKKLPVAQAGQLYFYQGRLYYTLEQQGESSIYVGEIIER